MDSIVSREAEIAKIAGSGTGVAALQRHLREIVQGKAFRGSLRSTQFLTYIVEQAIAGNFEQLKERVIGTELFQRPPSYDTGEDAIVRVTASDVRRRLLQHYDRYRAASDIHISLPLGSYVPEIIWDCPSGTNSLDHSRTRQDPSVAPTVSAGNQDSASVSVAVKEVAFDTLVEDYLETSHSYGRFRHRWLLVTVPLAALNIVLCGFLLYGFSRTKAAHVSVLPWSVLFKPPGDTHVITSDVDIVRIQRLIGRRISASDYAYRSFIPQLNALSPDDRAYLMQGDKSSTQDTQITAKIAELAGASGHRIEVEGARDLHFSDLRTNDNFILLGSPFSDPWFSVFNNQLDFRFVAAGEAGLGAEIIRNIHPRPNEQSIYAAAANGGATGESYAIVALVGNPSQSGNVLLLAGISGEGTLAAGELVTDLPRLSRTLKQCGILSPTPVRHFEMLLRVSLMAGYPDGYGVVACHLLPDNSSHT